MIRAVPAVVRTRGGPAREAIPPGLAPAYRHCAQVAARHYENFPVASRLLPAALRPHVAAIYAFARAADDFADEGARTPQERLRAIAGWRERLWACAGDRAPASPSVDRSGPSGDRPAPDHGDDAQLVFAALGHSIRECRLPVEWLDDLLSAFAQDVTTTRYATWDDLLDYCRRSANPVGRLVLRVAGYDDGALDRSSDALCSALQLTNFWQDLGIDWARGRLYLPLVELQTAGADVASFDPEQWSPECRVALGRAVDRTRALFEHGRAVCDGVSGRLRIELRLTWLGGVTILDRVGAGVTRARHERPSLSAADVPALLWRASTWRTR